MGTNEPYRAIFLRASTVSPSAGSSMLEYCAVVSRCGWPLQILVWAGDETFLGVVMPEILGLVLHPFKRTLEPIEDANSLTLGRFCKLDRRHSRARGHIRQDIDFTCELF